MTRARDLAELGRHPEAFDDATAAVELRRGILGMETQLANSPYLASMEAEHLGRPEEAQKLEDEADTLSQSNPDPQHRFAVEVETLFSSFDKATAEDLAKRAEASGAVEIVAAVLTESMALTDDPQLKELSRAMRDRALESGGTVLPPQPIPTLCFSVLGQLANQ